MECVGAVGLVSFTFGVHLIEIRPAFVVYYFPKVSDERNCLMGCGRINKTTRRDLLEKAYEQ